MFIVNPVFGVVAVGVVLALHAYLVKKHLKAPYGDVRSGLFVALAEWAEKKMENLAGPREKTWKANLLVPVEVSDEVDKAYGLLRDIAHPKGFVRLLGLTGKRNYDELIENLPKLAERLHEDRVFATWTVVQAGTFSENVAAGLEALAGAFFRSSLIFLRLPEDRGREEEVRRIIRSADRNGLGVLLYAGPGEIPEKGKAVHIVIEEPAGGWDIGKDLGESDLALLIAYQLKRNWKSDLTLVAALKRYEAREKALDYLRAVAELARIPNAGLRTAPLDGLDLREDRPSVTVYSLGKDPDLGALRSRVKAAQTPCLFAMDSGFENALA